MFSKNIAIFGFVIFLLFALSLTHAQYRPTARTTIATTTEAITTTEQLTITLAPTVTPAPAEPTPRKRTITMGRSMITLRPPPTRRLPPPLCWPRRPECNPNNPIICGRNRHGICRRFINACHMENVNCMLTQRDNVWQNTPAVQCTNIPPNTAAQCRIFCPRWPQRCVRRGPSLCVMDRTRKLCRRVTNECVLRNLNCYSSPRGNWSVTKMCKCKNMIIGGGATACCNDE